MAVAPPCECASSNIDRPVGLCNSFSRHLCNEQVDIEFVGGEGVSETILIEKHDGWVEITLNRPDRRNALNEEMHLALRAAITDAADDEDCRAVLLTGNGKGFCAGQDLSDRDPRKMDGPPNLSETINKFYNPLIRLIRGTPKPVVCAVNGVAAGAGANIALACDIVLAAESANFIQAFAKIGLIPDAGGSWSLTRLLGEARAKGLALTGEPLPAAKAADWGLIWKSLPDDKLMEEARALVSGFAKGPLDPIEIASRDEIAALQLDRLRWSLRPTPTKTSPHYRERAVTGTPSTPRACIPTTCRT
jgi:2-(1,2-epoxy-1,2-dihydrophenyl)acetyl-CoA isomerase